MLGYLWPTDTRYISKQRDTSHHYTTKILFVSTGFEDVLHPIDFMEQVRPPHSLAGGPIMSKLCLLLLLSEMAYALVNYFSISAGVWLARPRKLD